jgi:DNA-binding NarL/FixJ family response regulator
VIRVFIVASSPLARAGLESLLTARGFSVVGSSANLDSLSEQLADAEPDAVLLEASGEDSEAVLDTLNASDVASEIPLILLMGQPSPGFAAEALRVGVRAILPAEVSPDQLTAAVQAATAGLVIVHPSEVGAVLPAANASSRPLAELAEPLTPREREVLQMLASGLANKVIAARLSISDHTVKFHVASILGKLGASSRTEAVSLGIRYGLVLL